MQHNHTFEYHLTGGEDLTMPDQAVRFTMDGNINLSTIVEQFELYLKATGFVPPDNCRLEFVEQDSGGWNPPPLIIPEDDNREEDAAIGLENPLVSGLC